MPRTAILYARSQRRDELDRQVRELEDWCDRAGVVPVDTVAEVALGNRASKRCREVLAEVAAGRADLMLIRDISRLSENSDQLQEIVDEHRHRIVISRDDADPCR
ncbi:MAG TPA: recombinase family protein [Pseudonocardiaceae bacterium]|nr:recombinase family protein [Pseudonocardiaceae bacterium]